MPFKSIPIKKFFYNSSLVIPAVILSFAFLILIDNFTYTIFGYGIISVKKWGKVIYLILLIILFAFLFRGLVIHAAKEKIFFLKKILNITPAILLIISLSSAIISYISKIPGNEIKISSSNNNNTNNNNFPNILLIATDGWSASHAQFYGYQRSTTPFISKFIADRGLICENAFPNSAVTGGSTCSLLTGKLPTTTRVFSAPDILKGIHSYQHLPGILRLYGYRSIQLTERYYADAYDVNMIASFDYANFRKSDRDKSLIYFDSVLNQGNRYFINRLHKRLQNRLFHISGIKEMKNVYANVTGQAREEYRDQNRINKLLSFIDKNPGPFFAQVQHMGTHGPRFNPQNRLFSKDKEQKEDWMEDFYDDALLDFDMDFMRIFMHLEKKNKIKNTIFIFHSDHGMGWEMGVKIPLVFIFPDQKYRGYITANTQLLDVAPTILDYLGIEKPAWMQGQSLLNANPHPYRPVFSMRPFGGRDEDSLWINEGIKHGPPFYSLGKIEMIICHKIFGLKFSPTKFYSYEVGTHTSPCNTSEIPSDSQAFEMIKDHLKTNLYDVSSIK